MMGSSTHCFWFGHEAHLTYLPFEAWRETAAPADAEQTLEHIGHSPNASIAKARQHIGYQPATPRWRRFMSR